MSCLRVTERPLAVEGGRPTRSVLGANRRGGTGPRGLRLVGDLAMDGQIEADLLLVALHADPEHERGDLDDDEGGDDRVADGRADGDDLGDDLTRIPVDQARIALLDCRRCEDTRRDGT